MTPRTAHALLRRLGFRPGVDSTRGHPERARIKQALSVVAASRVQIPPPPEPPEPPKRTPRTAAAVKDRRRG